VVTFTTRDEPAGIEFETVTLTVAESDPLGVTTVTATGFEVIMPPAVSVAVAVSTASPGVVGVQLTLNGEVVSVAIGVPFTENWTDATLKPVPAVAVARWQASG
jgi:hypothetical protein